MPTEIHKFANGQYNAITEIAYQDGGTLRDITEVHYNDAGTFRQVFGAGVTPQVPAWAASSPSDNYRSLGTEGLNSSVVFTANTSGSFAFAFDEIERPASDGDPTFGTYKPILEVDAGNYEIAITFSGGLITAVGSGTVIDGTFQDLNTTRGIRIDKTGTGSTVSTITVEIRDKNTPANTTGVATFVIDALVLA